MVFLRLTDHRHQCHRPSCSSFSSGTDNLTGTTGNDILNAPGSVTTLVAGLDGNDTITLVKGDDEAEGGAGNDSITLNAASINNTVDGGAGADTIYITTAATTFGGSYNMGDGADLVSMTANSNNVSVGGNKGSDTITFGGNIINALVGGGANADSIGFDTAVTNSTVFGGGGKDTINIRSHQLDHPISDGHDLITTTGATAAFGTSMLLLVRVTTQSSLVLLVSQLSWVVLETTPLTLLITATVA